MDWYVKRCIKAAIYNAILFGVCIFSIFYFKVSGFLFIICVVFGWAGLWYCIGEVGEALKAYKENKNK